MLPLVSNDKTMDNVVFRRAVPEDAFLWASTRQKVWETTYRGIYPNEWIDNYDLPTKMAKDRENLENPDVISYVAMDGDRCVGYFSYGPVDGGEFYLRNLYFLLDYQGKGLGKLAFSYLQKDCIRLGYSGFYVHCNYHNLPARRFYVHMGGVYAGNNGFHKNKAEDQCRYNYTITAMLPEGER